MDHHLVPNICLFASLSTLRFELLHLAITLAYTELFTLYKHIQSVYIKKLTIQGTLNESFLTVSYLIY